MLLDERERISPNHYQANHLIVSGLCLAIQRLLVFSSLTILNAPEPIHSILRSLVEWHDTCDVASESFGGEVL